MIDADRGEIEHRVAVWQDAVDRVIVLDPSGGVLADGPTESVLTVQGERLAAAGAKVAVLKLPNHSTKFEISARKSSE